MFAKDDIVAGNETIHRELLARLKGRQELTASAISTQSRALGINGSKGAGFGLSPVCAIFRLAEPHPGVTFRPWQKKSIR